MAAGNGATPAQRLGSEAQAGTKFEFDDADVVVVIGSGAGGGTVANELCPRGIRTVVLEAGPHLTADDYSQEEWPAFNQMAWLDARTTSGNWRVAKDFPNLPCWTVKAVAGTTTDWAGACPRFKEYEFRIKQTYGGGLHGANLLNWPIGLADLEPYYDLAEVKMGVTHRHGRPPLPANNNYKVFANGAEKTEYGGYATGPYATFAEPYDERPATIQDGFNFQGDKHGGKWSTLIGELPKAARTGKLDLRADAHAFQITHDARGRADGVVYLDSEGSPGASGRRPSASPATRSSPPGCCSSPAPRRTPTAWRTPAARSVANYMRHLTASVYGRFPKPVRMYRGETMAGIIADESEHDPDRGFAGGIYFETLSLGVPFLAAFVDPGAWGPDFTATMGAYENTAGMWIVGEDMPQEGNGVTLNPDVSDQHGLPAPNVHFDDHANDVPPYPSTHNLGTCRMSERAEDGVVDSFGRAHDVPNLFVSDGSVFTSGAAANPTLTIVALAIRQAEYIAAEIGNGGI